MKSFAFPAACTAPCVGLFGAKFEGPACADPEAGLRGLGLVALETSVLLPPFCAMAINC